MTAGEGQRELTSQRAELPAAQVLANVERHRGAYVVHLPPRFARAALEQLFAAHHAEAAIIEGPAIVAGQSIDADEWVIRHVPSVGAPLHFVGRSAWTGRERLFRYALYEVVLTPPDAQRLLRCLEAVKPEELDATGRPFPWVPVKPRVEALGARGDNDDDATEVGAGEVLPKLESGEVGGEREWLAALATTAGVPIPELGATRTSNNRLGFTAGRIWYDAAFVPLRMQLTVCPNADMAEIVATIAHELAHPLARLRGHGLPFKAALVELVSRHFGARYFDGAKARLGESYRVVDSWVASGIRAALRNGDAPQAKPSDDAQLAKVLMRIRKLRDLAADQVGRPEGIAATAAANDLVTAYGLEGYNVKVGEVDDQMVDLFVPLEENALWRRTLAHAVAAYCDVFSLAMTRGQRMHFFGRHGDVVTAEYLYSVSAGRITRECVAHIARWKRGRGGSTAGETRSEKTSFCDSATMAFKRKLEVMKAEDGGRSGLETAEAFADDEHDKRGQSWGSGGRRSYRDNAAGRAVGEDMDVTHGIGGERPKGLPHR